MRFRIYPHQLGSQGAARLRDALKHLGHRVLLVKPDGNYRPRPNDTIIGWGNSTVPVWANRIGPGNRWVNRPDRIALATNKLVTFQQLEEAKVPTPQFTTSLNTALGWLQEEKRVIGRATLTGSRGEGIIVLNKPEDMPQQPLRMYTLWKSADREYRVYVLGEQVVDYLQKKRPNGAGELGIIRSAAAGWVYCRNDIRPLPDAAAQVAVSACRALGLDFGGVDLLWGNKTGARVLEINTSPGIDGVGVTQIANAFHQQYGVVNQ